MSEDFVSVRIAFVAANANGKSVEGTKKHNERIGHQPDYVDTLKSSENSVILEIPDADELKKMCEAYRDQRQLKRKIKSNASLLVDGIITFSTSAQKKIEALSNEEQDVYFKKCADGLSAKLNSDLVGLVVHRDESAIHAHFALLAFDKKGFALSDIVTRETTSRLQDTAGEAFHELQIKRGIKKFLRMENGEDRKKFVHRSVKQLHKDLPEDIAEKQKELEELDKKIEARDKKSLDAFKKIKEAKKLVQDFISDFDVNLKDIEEKQKLENEITEKIELKQKELDSIKPEFEKKQEALNTLKVQTQEKQRQLDELNKDVNEKIKEYDDKLEKNKALLLKAQKDLDATQKKLESNIEMEKKILKRIDAYNNRINDSQTELNTLEIKKDEIQSIITNNEKLINEIETKTIKNIKPIEITRKTGTIKTEKIEVILNEDFEQAMNFIDNYAKNKSLDISKKQTALYKKEENIAFRENYLLEQEQKQDKLLNLAKLILKEPELLRNDAKHLLNDFLPQKNKKQKNIEI